MTNIAVPVPPSLMAYRAELRTFFAGMVRKLDMNSHKNIPDRVDVEKLIAGALRELAEFQEQLAENRLDPNSLIELMDSSNFMFLAYVALRNSGAKTPLEEFIDEYYVIDAENGSVHCRKTRAGALYKAGEVVKGSISKGRCYIKIQARRTAWGASSLPRSHLVWWKANGKWPVGVIDHINGDALDDRISNLRDVSFSENNFNTKRSRDRKLPRFVGQYKPNGREHLPQYGKYYYLRHHDGKVFRMAYYDTPEQASVDGEIAWAKKVKEEEKNNGNS